MCRRAAFEFGFDGFGQLFAVFHAPLVEGVDTPNHTLYEGAVFVSRHQHAEVERSQAVDEQAVARAVAREFFLRRKAVAFVLGEGGQFDLHFV